MIAPDRTTVPRAFRKRCEVEGGGSASLLVEGGAEPQ